MLPSRVMPVKPIETEPDWTLFDRAKRGDSK